ncbi:MFS transporter [Haliangium ochraceum]|uniref:MFS transporter n=1 Tax=Haliangium ochraceum TaxID=80816 RepID=UPI00019B9B96|nr:MFS transporter [Haliangium ochraceum]
MSHKRSRAPDSPPPASSRRALATALRELFRPRPASAAVAIGFTFMVGFYGMVFLMSLFFQEQRGMSAFSTGLAFMPVTGFSIVMPILAARIAERLGAWVPIVIGQVSMAAGLFALSAFADTASLSALVAMMALVGIGGGTAMPSATSLLLNTAADDRSGTASGVLNTSRQVGGATAIAAFGALIAGLGYDAGMTLSVASAGALLVASALLSLGLRTRSRRVPYDSKHAHLQVES